MRLFSLSKKESCSCTGEHTTSNSVNQEECRVKVLGSGCSKCNQLEEATKEALAELGMSMDIEHVKEYSRIASFGVMSTPALVIDSKVVSTGKVLKKEEVIRLLKENM